MYRLFSSTNKRHVSPTVTRGGLRLDLEKGNADDRNNVMSAKQKSGGNRQNGNLGTSLDSQGTIQGIV